MITDREGLLLNTIAQLGDLEWRKYRSRYPEVFVEGRFQHKDMSAYPPFWSFRFKCENNVVVNSLMSIVDEYDGHVRWVMSGRPRDGLPGTNWIICPEFVDLVKGKANDSGLGAEEYIAKNFPGFGPVAYSDADGLNAYVRLKFGLKY